MLRLIQSPVCLLAVVLSITACGGFEAPESANIVGAPGAGGESPNPVQTPLATTPDGLVIFLDNYSAIDGAESTLFNASSASGEQHASFFSLPGAATINELKWVGVAQNNTNLADGQANFIVRIHAHNDDASAATAAAHEVSVSATASPLGENTFGDIYEFTVAGQEMFSLAAGSYWLSIVDPETEGVQFIWAIEKNTTAGVKSGSGGAMRVSESAAWQSVSGEFAATQARGRNVRIAGMLQ